MRSTILLSVAIVVLGACQPDSQTQNQTQNLVQNQAAQLQILNPYIAEAPPVAKVMAGYLTLINNGTRARVITNASSKQFESVEVHITFDTEGMASMIEQKETLIAPGQRLPFAPGSLHLMLLRPQQALKLGDQVEIELGFADGEKLTALFPVKPLDTTALHNHAH